MAPELGVRCDSPLNIQGDLQEKTGINAKVPAHPSSQEGPSPGGRRTHLDERCRAGQGLGVSLLRLWPGEWLSPRWPLREPRSLLLQHRIHVKPYIYTPTHHTAESQNFLQMMVARPGWLRAGGKNTPVALPLLVPWCGLGRGAAALNRRVAEGAGVSEGVYWFPGAAGPREQSRSP